MFDKDRSVAFKELSIVNKCIKWEQELDKGLKNRKIASSTFRTLRWGRKSLYFVCLSERIK
jgi:hypothetical protein